VAESSKYTQPPRKPQKSAELNPLTPEQMALGNKVRAGIEKALVPAMLTTAAIGVGGAIAGTRKLLARDKYKSKRDRLLNKVQKPDNM
jgi:hypothetical protein